MVNRDLLLNTSLITSPNYNNPNLINDLLSFKSYKAFRDILNGVQLEDFQTVGVLRALVFEKFILRYDTGLGKTLVSSGIMKLVLNKNVNRKFLFLGKNVQLIQTPKDIERVTGLKVMSISAEEKDRERLYKGVEFSRCDVLFITPECLNSPGVMGFINHNIDKFIGMILDEAHEFTNYVDSNRGMMLKGLVCSFRYVIALTATPITSSEETLARLMNLVAPSFFPNVRDEVRVLKKMMKESDSNVKRLENKYIGFMQSVNREGSEFIPYVHTVRPMDFQLCAKGQDMFERTKGRGATRQINKLKEIINNRPNKKGIIYIRRTSIRDYVCEELTKAGISYGCINGSTNQEEKEFIQNQFNSDEIPLVITSITTSLNLNCNYIVFYEFTSDIIQMMGRGNRGLESKRLELHFIFTLDTGEVDYFKEKIMTKSLIAKNLLGVEISALEQVNRQIR